MAVLPGVAAADSPTLNRIKATGTITFGYRDNAVPFSYKDRDGRVRGYSVELCMRVAGSIQNELGLTALKIEWLPVEASNRLDYVISGKVDAVCGTTTITLGRMQKVDFSLPIYVDGGTMLVRARSKLGRLPDLKGKRVAVIAGTTTEEELGRGLDARRGCFVAKCRRGNGLLDKGSWMATPRPHRARVPQGSGSNAPVRTFVAGDFRTSHSVSHAPTIPISSSR